MEMVDVDVCGLHTGRLAAQIGRFGPNPSELSQYIVLLVRMITILGMTTTNK